MRDPNTAITDGFVSRGMLEAITALPKKTQTSLLSFLAQLGAVDAIDGNSLLSAVLEFSASEGVRRAGRSVLKRAARAGLLDRADDFDIDMLRTIAEAPSDYHAPLLKLLLAARPMGHFARDMVVLEVWTRVRSHLSRTMGPNDVDRVTRIVALGSDFDDIVLRFLENSCNDRGEVMEREIQARLEARSRDSFTNDARPTP